jgi:hypothetical protein
LLLVEGEYFRVGGRLLVRPQNAMHASACERVLAVPCDAQ